jgi:hypothetical protein
MTRLFARTKLQRTKKPANQTEVAMTLWAVCLIGTQLTYGARSPTIGLRWAVTVTLFPMQARVLHREGKSAS